MASFPRDQFDDLPRDLQRIGAHRAPGRRGRGWIAVAWAALATGLLVVAGIFALSLYDSNFEIPGLTEETPSETPTPEVAVTAEPVTDPASLDATLLEQLSIAVLNGTTTQGLSNTAGDQILAAGWPNPSRASASDTAEEQTIVYYSSADFEGVARGIMLLVGAADVQLSDAFPSSITVVLGADYVAPAAG